MYYVYILTNKTNTVLYIGVTNHIERRLAEHKSELIEGFTKKYHVHKLVYLECFSNPDDAIKREKYLKGRKRERKLSLIKSANPNFLDLSQE